MEIEDFLFGIIIAIIFFALGFIMCGITISSDLCIAASQVCYWEGEIMYKDIITLLFVLLFAGFLLGEFYLIYSPHDLNNQYEQSQIYEQQQLMEWWDKSLVCDAKEDLCEKYKCHANLELSYPGDDNLYDVWNNRYQNCLLEKIVNNTNAYVGAD